MKITRILLAATAILTAEAKKKKTSSEQQGSSIRLPTVLNTDPLTISDFIPAPHTRPDMTTPTTLFGGVTPGHYGRCSSGFWDWVPRSKRTQKPTTGIATYTETILTTITVVPVNRVKKPEPPPPKAPEAPKKPGLKPSGACTPDPGMCLLITDGFQLPGVTEVPWTGVCRWTATARNGHTITAEDGSVSTTPIVVPLNCRSKGGRCTHIVEELFDEEGFATGMRNECNQLTPTKRPRLPSEVKKPKNNPAASTPAPSAEAEAKTKTKTKQRKGSWICVPEATPSIRHLRPPVPPA